MAIYALGDDVPQFPADGDYWVAPDAILIGKVRLLKGASVWFGAVLRGDNEWLTIGENSNVQDCSVLHTDPGAPVLMGSNVTVGHSVVVHGCEIGDNTLIGMGATICSYTKIGRNCMVGAGAVLPEGKIYPDRSLIVGVPARATRTLSDEEVAARLDFAAQHYVETSRHYKNHLRRIG